MVLVTTAVLSTTSQIGDSSSFAGIHRSGSALDRPCCHVQRKAAAFLGTPPARKARTLTARQLRAGIVTQAAATAETAGETCNNYASLCLRYLQLFYGTSSSQ